MTLEERRCRRLTSEEATMQVLRMPELVRMTGLSAPTIYRLRRAGDFPAPLRLSLNAVGWLRQDVERWLEERQARPYKPKANNRKAKSARAHEPAAGELSKAAAG